MSDIKATDKPSEDGLNWEDADSRTVTETIFFNRDGDHAPDTDVTIRVKINEPEPAEFSTPVGRMKLARWEGIGRCEGELYELAVMCWNKGGFKLLRKINVAEARKVIADKSPILAALFV